ncbi:MAG: hypothetical protein J0I62_18940 [Microbacterium sp.]|nr:hypothetical protein [Microbacterium sp.]
MSLKRAHHRARRDQIIDKGRQGTRGCALVDQCGSVHTAILSRVSKLCSISSVSCGNCRIHFAESPGAGHAVKLQYVEGMTGVEPAPSANRTISLEVAAQIKTGDVLMEGAALPSPSAEAAADRQAA